MIFVRLAAAAALLYFAAAWGGPLPYNQRDDVRGFIAEMVRKHGFLKAELERVFGRARYQATAVKAISPAPESSVRSWHSYRALFLSGQRLNAGVEFWYRHAQALVRAHDEFGVPQEIIVAILGVETFYGRNMGSYRVIDALTTLAFDSPRRAEFFRSELENYLLHARETGIDVFETRGSPAGAIGIPQFMPGSYRRYAVDYDGDGRADLTSSAIDAIGSVGNFLREHGWERGGSVAVPASVRGEAWRPLTDAGIRPTVRAADLANFGVRPAEHVADDSLCALIELETPGRDSEFWVGLNNFHVLTRYNRSSFYAIAVLEFARSLKQAAKP